MNNSTFIELHILKIEQDWIYLDRDWLSIGESVIRKRDVYINTDLKCTVTLLKEGNNKEGYPYKFQYDNRMLNKVFIIGHNLIYKVEKPLTNK